MAGRPMLTMMVAQQVALRAGELAVLMTECESVALVAAIEKLAVFATALCNARDHIQNAPPAGSSQRARSE